MNKIIIDTNEYNLELRNNSYLDIRSDSIINIEVKTHKKINLLVLSKQNKVTINIKLYDNTNVEINSLGINACINYNIKENNNCNIFVVSSIISKIDSINLINVNLVGNNNITKFYTNGINLSNNKLYFNLNGIIKKNLNNCYLEENSKIINIDDGDSKIVPNLIIDTKEVVANHSAFIGTFNKNDLYYLMSRGINKTNAYRLLIKSILLSNMKLNTSEFLNSISDFIGVGGDVCE